MEPRVNIGSVDEQAATGGRPGQPVYRPQSPASDLMMLRAAYPFLPILPMPSLVISTYTVFGQSQLMNIPSAAKIIWFNGPPADWFISFQGPPTILSATPTQGVPTNTIYAPNNILFYVGGSKQIGVQSLQAGQQISMCCIIPETDYKV